MYDIVGLILADIDSRIPSTKLWTLDDVRDIRSEKFSDTNNKIFNGKVHSPHALSRLHLYIYCG